VKKSFDIASIAAGSRAEVTTATLKDVNLKKIEITVANAVNSVKLEVTKIASSDKPSSVTVPSNKVYHYIQIDKVNLTDADITAAKLEFQVERSWLTGNNIDESTVKLNRFSNNAWATLTTAKTGEDATYVFYQADSPGLSVFSITAEEKPTPTPTTAAAQPTVPPAATATPVPAATPKPAAAGADTAVIAAVIIVIAGAAYFYRDKLKKAFKMS